MGFIYISAGTLNIEAEGDGISASAYMQIVDGTFSVLAGGGSENGSSQSSNTWGAFMGGDMPRDSKVRNTATTEDSTSMKGIKTSGTLNIFSGSFQINSSDDCIHSNSSITIYGGTFELASGDDAVHADETLTVTACDMNISESCRGIRSPAY
ncbi:MAG: carbohydrate-binding domain-containing protein [Eubacteriales bacterium]